MPSRLRSRRSAAWTCSSSTRAARHQDKFADLDEAAWTTAIDGTLWSALRLLRAALPHLRDGRDPAVLVILSSSAREPIPGLTTSNLIRPGLAGLIKSMVEEIVPVRINGLAPGRLATDRIAQLDAARSAASGLSGRGGRSGRRSLASRSAAMAIHASLAASRHSCSRRRRPTSRARSCRSMAA